MAHAKSAGGAVAGSETPVPASLERAILMFKSPDGPATAEALARMFDKGDLGSWMPKTR
jgi:hypothetical protein